MKNSEGIINVKKKIANKRAYLEKNLYHYNCNVDTCIKTFIAELDDLKDEIDNMLDCDLNIKVVPKQTFDKEIAKADFVNIEFEGEFCSIALIRNYLYDDIYIIYTESLKSLVQSVTKSV